ncbi:MULTISPECIES: helix-turn-helix domain-containing protein [Streptomycetaceae]|uniref:Helix-turn-helix domain-containing protein n=2 Tax=Streptomycetaceae TaxID=2062 RepID=A0AA41U208_9ACTN|nr:helix-turn-helix domain-containing protein [Yinghuangia soli]MCF2526634.1 helix-turn-helix domain-containing protein [Yinghuangia soli]
MPDRFLSVPEVAERMGFDNERFVRRLVAERRIQYVKFGSHVRIKESVVIAYIDANTVQPLRPRRRTWRAA